MSAGLPNILEDSDGVRYVYGLDLISRIDGSTAGLIIARGSFGDRFERDGAVFYDSCWGLCSLFRLAPNARSITIGSYVFSRGDIDEVTILHELEHLRQGDQHGLMWPFRYFSEEISEGYRCNRFEEEARRVAGQRQRCSKE